MEERALALPTSKESRGDQPSEREVRRHGYAARDLEPAARPPTSPGRNRWKKCESVADEERERERENLDNEIKAYRRNTVVPDPCSPQRIWDYWDCFLHRIEVQLWTKDASDLPEY